MYNDTLLDLHLSPFIYRWLRGHEPTLDDLIQCAPVRAPSFLCSRL